MTHKMYDILMEMDNSLSKIMEIGIFDTPHCSVQVDWKEGSYSDDSEPDHIFGELNINIHVEELKIEPDFLSNTMNEIGEYFRSRGFTSGRIYFDISDLKIRFLKHYIFNVLDHVHGELKNKIRFGMVPLSELQGGHAYDFVKMEDLFDMDVDLGKWVRIKLKRIETITRSLKKGTTPDGMYYEIDNFYPHVSQDSLKFVPSQKTIKPHFHVGVALYLDEKYKNESLESYLKSRFDSMGIPTVIFSYSTPAYLNYIRKNNYV